MTLRKKLQITIVCLSVILCTLVTGTIAWLTDKTGSVTNTFTPSNISISLTEENKGDNYKFQMIPGKTYAKDPKVTVTTDIPCYVFVKIEKANGFDDFMEYTMADGWNELAGITGVYYREVSATDAAAGQGFPVLKDNQVTVKANVTKAMMDALYADTTKYPTLTFTAYAIQQEGFGTAELAWAEIPK